MMKIIKVLAFSIVLLFIGYIVGSFFPIGSLFNISGDVKLQVTVLREDKSPVPNIEVDVAKIPGPPPASGIGHTNGNGVANFEIKPGDYYLFFNADNFPTDLVTELRPIAVKKGELNQETVILKKK